MKQRKNHYHTLITFSIIKCGHYSDEFNIEQLSILQKELNCLENNPQIKKVFKEDLPLAVKFHLTQMKLSDKLIRLLREEICKKSYFKR
jgi:hypothetical protein